MVKEDLEAMKNVLCGQQKVFFITVMEAIENGKSEAICECGGIIRIRKSKVNHHIHAKCEKCGSAIMQ